MRPCIRIERGGQINCAGASLAGAAVPGEAALLGGGLNAARLSILDLAARGQRSTSRYGDGGSGASFPCAVRLRLGGRGHRVEAVGFPIHCSFRFPAIVTDPPLGHACVRLNCMSITRGSAPDELEVLNSAPPENPSKIDSPTLSNPTASALASAAVSSAFSGPVAA